VLLWALVAIGAYVALKLWILRAQFWQPTTGVEGMRGRVATALTDLSPRGQVDFDGELWSAQSSQRVAAGERVRIDSVDGLTLLVHPANFVRSADGPRGSLLLSLARKLRSR
jgi:membrane-bound serine protease (ClpP class)